MRKPPSYPKKPHSSGQARITVDGKDYYLGRWGTPESRAAHARFVLDWVARKGPPIDIKKATISSVCDSYLNYAKTYYVKRERPTGEYHKIKHITETIKGLFGSYPIGEFRQDSLKALRAHWVEKPCSLNVVNQYVKVVVRMFGWAAEEGIVPKEIHDSLRSVRSLVRGRTTARVYEPIGPAPEASVEATLAVLDRENPTMAAMVRVQRLTGMRPIEVCYMRPEDLRETEDGLEYVVPPEANKEDHVGKARVVMIGPRARAILAPFLEGHPGKGRAVFRIKRRGRWKAGEWPGYDPRSYNDLVVRACRRAKAPTFTVNQLRHSAATEARKRFGLEMARVMLGHSDQKTTTVYAEQDRARARREIDEIG